MAFAAHFQSGDALAERQLVLSPQELVRLLSSFSAAALTDRGAMGAGGGDGMGREKEKLACDVGNGARMWGIGGKEWGARHKMWRTG